MISSPSKKPKQSSLSEFYKKLQHHQQIQQIRQHLSIRQNSQTPKKRQSSKQKISTLSYSQVNTNKMSNTQYGQLDLSSNMKVKLDDLFQKQQKIEHNNNHQRQNRLFKQFQPVISQISPVASQIEARQQSSYFDYNLSIEPQQIKVPLSRNTQINEFKLQELDKQYNNYLSISPQASQIKYSQIVNKNRDSFKRTPKKTKINQQNSPQINQHQQRQQSRLHSEVISYTQLTKIQPKLYQQLAQAYQKLTKKYQNQAIIDKKQTKDYQKQTKAYQKQPKTYQKQTKTVQSSQKVTKQQNKSSKTISATQIEVLDSQSEILSDQDATQLLSRIKQLQSQVEVLKTHKYQFAVDKFRKQTENQLVKSLEIQIANINLTYLSKKQALNQQKQLSLVQHSKSLEDITKYKKTFYIILDQMKVSKTKIQEQYSQKLEQVVKIKQKLVTQWKRQSNQQIKKIVTSTHMKHSTHSSLNQHK